MAKMPAFHLPMPKRFSPALTVMAQKKAIAMLWKERYLPEERIA